MMNRISTVIGVAMLAGMYASSGLFANGAPVNEMWVAPAAKTVDKNVGDWAVADEKTHFNIALPSDMLGVEGVYVVVIGKKDKAVNYDLYLSMAHDGSVQDEELYEALDQGFVLVKDQLLEIDISTFIEDSLASHGPEFGVDYLGLNVEIKDAQVVGLRFQYMGRGLWEEDDPTVPGWVKDGTSWDEVTGKPLDFQDGEINWNEIGSKPADFQDGKISWDEVRYKPASAHRYYWAKGPTVEATADGGQGYSTAVCDLGDLATGGGWQLASYFPATISDLVMMADRPKFENTHVPTPDAWGVAILNRGPSRIQYYAYAVCADFSP